VTVNVKFVAAASAASAIFQYNAELLLAVSERAPIIVQLAGGEIAPTPLDTICANIKSPTAKLIGLVITTEVELAPGLAPRLLLVIAT
jgi:hypothetical protein